MHLSFRGRHVDAGPPFPPPLLCRSANIITAAPYASGAETLIIRTTTAHSLHARSGLAMATNDSSLGIPLPAKFPPNHNAGRSVLILVWILFGASTALVAARIYSKIAILKRFATDDVLMSLSWVRHRMTPEPAWSIWKLTPQPGFHIGLLRRHSAFVSLRAWPALRIPHHPDIIPAIEVGLRRICLLHRRPSRWASQLHSLPAQHHRQSSAWHAVLAVVTGCITDRDQHRSTHCDVFHLRHEPCLYWNVGLLPSLLCGHLTDAVRTAQARRVSNPPHCLGSLCPLEVSANEPFQTMIHAKLKDQR